MNLTARLALHERLRRVNQLSEQLAEALREDRGPLAIVAHVDALHTAAAELLGHAVGIIRQPNELPFTGGNVAIGEPIAPGSAADKANQRPSDGWAELEKRGAA